MLELIPIYCSVIAYVYASILMDDDMLLYGWKKFLKKYERIHWLYMILTCPLCFSGQLALWSYIFTQPFDIIQLIFIVSLTILLTKILQKCLS